MKLFPQKMLIIVTNALSLSKLDSKSLTQTKALLYGATPHSEEENVCFKWGKIEIDRQKYCNIAILLYLCARKCFLSSVG